MRAGDTFQTWVSEGPDRGYWNRWEVVESSRLRQRDYHSHARAQIHEALVRNQETDEHRLVIAVWDGIRPIKWATYFEREVDGRYFFDARLLEHFIRRGW